MNGTLVFWAIDRFFNRRSPCVLLVLLKLELSRDSELITKSKITMPEVTSNKELNLEDSSIQSKKGFFDLTPDEIENKAQIAVEKAVKRMHSKGIATIISVDGKMYLQYPDGSKKPYFIELDQVGKYLINLELPLSQTVKIEYRDGVSRVEGVE